MTVVSNHFGWLRRRTAWESTQAWKSQRSTMVQRFVDTGATAASAFASAQANLSLGLATIAAQAANQRTVNALKAAQQRISAATNKVNMLT
jgi:hypothetical protein